MRNGMGRTPLHNANDSESLVISNKLTYFILGLFYFIIHAFYILTVLSLLFKEILLNAGADINGKDSTGKKNILQLENNRNVN